MTKMSRREMGLADLLGNGKRWPRKFGQSDKWNARGLSRR